MPGPHPHSTADLALAPVLINIERNLARLRASRDLEFAFALELNDDDRWYHDAAARAHRVEMIATRDVDLHGWHIRPTSDLQGLVVEHGGFAVPVMLGRRLSDYIAAGTPEAYFARRRRSRAHG